MNITIQATLNTSINDAWAAWTQPEHIVHWNFASDEWRCPSASVDLTVGGAFNYRMEARDGSMGFDFEGVFTKLTPNRTIKYVLADQRTVQIEFSEVAGEVVIKETFTAEDQMSGEQQRQGWQSILDNFKQYAENFGRQ